MNGLAPLKKILLSRIAPKPDYHIAASGIFVGAREKEERKPVKDAVRDEFVEEAGDRISQDSRNSKSGKY